MDALMIKKRYDQCCNYFSSQGFYGTWAECERFYSSNQWAKATARTKNYPRPVLNVIKSIEGHKISQILQEPVKLVFTPDEVEDEQAQIASDLYTRYAVTQWENIGQDKINEECLETAANIGTMFVHYRWDSKKEGGKKLQYIGDIAGEQLDPINCMAGNPQEKDVQKQPYWIIPNRETLEHIKKEAELNGAPKEELDKITGDSDVTKEAYDTAKIEVEGTEKATVLTMYWREKGSVHVMKVCGEVIVKPDTDTEHKLYPIVGMCWYNRKKSLYGKGDTEAIIPNQKVINRLYAMQIKAIELMGVPRLVYNPTYIENDISSDPSVMIQDTSPGTNAVHYLQPSAMPGIVQTINDSMISLTKSLNGASDYSTGELMKNSGQISATAIMLLQKSAAVPVEQIKERFHRFIEDIGRIWLEFWQIEYNTERLVTVKDDFGQTKNAKFRGSDYKDLNMRIKIDVGSSTQYSDTLALTSLDNFLKDGRINFEQYLTLAPSSTVPFKEQLLKMIQKQAEEQKALAAAMTGGELPTGIMPPGQEMPGQGQPQPAPNPQGNNLNGMGAM